LEQTINQTKISITEKERQAIDTTTLTACNSVLHAHCIVFLRPCRGVVCRGARLLQSPDNGSRALPEPTTFFKRSSVENVQNTFFSFFKFSGLCPETRSLFVGVPKNNQGTIQKSFFVTFLKKGNAKNFYM
jgi:hypothetical protein